MNDIEKLQNWRRYYGKKFKKIFNFEMPFDIHGIDVYKLDGILQTPDGISTKEFIAEKYGSDACDFVVEILSNSPYSFKEG